MPDGTSAHFADASVRVQQQKDTAMLPGQCRLQAASHSCRWHDTGDGQGTVLFHLEDVEGRFDGGLLMLMRIWGLAATWLFASRKRTMVSIGL